MRHLRILSLVGSLAVAAGAQSVMDLQFVKRWNLSSQVTCQFLQIVANPQGGYVGLGTISNADLALISFDANGNILASKRWDSPLRNDDRVGSIEVDGDGDVYLLATGGTSLATPQLYFTKFDGQTLATQWERRLDAPAQNAFTSYEVRRTGSGAGEVLMVATTQSNAVNVYRYTKLGAVQGVTNLGHGGEIKSAVHVPAAAQGGMAMGGLRDSKPWICQVNGAGTLLVDHQVNLDGARVVDLALTTANRIVAVGGPFQGSSALTVWRQEANGSFTPHSSATLYASGGIARANGDIFIIAAGSTQGPKMVTYSATSGAFGTAVDNATYASKVVVNNSIGVYSVNGGTAFGFSNPLGQSSTGGLSDMRSTVSIDNDLLSVGTEGRLFSYRMGMLSTGLTVTGYTPKEATAATPDGQGGLFQVVGGAGGYYLQRMNSAGAILWTRYLAIPGIPPAYFSRIGFYGNRDLAVAGRTQNGFVLARVTTAGTLVFSKRLISYDPKTTTLSGFMVDNQDRPWFLAASEQPGPSYVSTIVRTQADGSNPEVLYGSAGSSGYRKAGTLPGGGWAMLDGNSPTKVVRMNSAGQVLNIADVSTSDVSDMDTESGTGRIATVGINMTGLEVTIREADFTPSLQTTITGANVGLVRFAPGGEIRVAYMIGGVSHLRSYTAQGAMAWDQTLPASVDFFTDLDVDPANGWAYLLCVEGNFEDQNANVVRYLANGIRSAQRRTAGISFIGVLNGPSYWALGRVTTRGKSEEAYSAKWSLP